MKAINYIKSFFRSEWEENKQAYMLWWQAQKRKRAIKLADRRHKADGRTYYVIKAGKTFLVVNSSEVKRLKRAGVIKKNVTVYDLITKSLYTTYGK